MQRAKNLIAQKRKQRQKLLDDFQTQYGKRTVKNQIDILNASASEIVSRITKTKEWTAEQVLLAYCKHVASVHASANCITEVLFDSALEQARQLDKEFVISGKPAGPLHGVPISIKDHFNLIGTDSTAGYTRYCNQPTTEADGNAALVSIMLDAGGIVFCKTNVPQTMMTFECDNPLYGRTLNPHNPRLTCGGSSGGEAAILGAGASVLGLGSDVAGSLRIPAHFSGCYALKPSSGRWPTGGNTMGLNGQEAIVTVFGPMARNVQDLCLAMQVVSNSRPWLRYRECLPLPLVCCADENIPPKQQQQQLKFGYYLSDGFLEPTSPCRRAVQVVVDRLEAAGHKCIPFDIRQAMDPVEMIQIFYGLVGADGCRSVRKTLRSDPLDPAISQLLAVMNLPRSIKRLAGRILRAISQPKAAAVLTAFDGSSVQELWQLQYRRQKFCERFHKYFMESGVDLLICPVNVHPAIPHGTFKDMSFAACYTMLYNLLDYAVGVLPVTKVCQQDYNAKLPGSIWQALRSGHCLLDFMAHQHFDCIIAAGAPVGVQVVGGRLDEQKTLIGMQLIDELV